MKYKQIWKTAAACLMAAVMLPGCSDEEGGGTEVPTDRYRTVVVTFNTLDSAEPVGTRAEDGPVTTEPDTEFERHIEDYWLVILKRNERGDFVFDSMISNSPESTNPEPNSETPVSVELEIEQTYKFYALANLKGLSDDGATAINYLNGLTQGNEFNLKQAVTVKDMATYKAGKSYIPMSSYGYELTVADDSQLSIPLIRLIGKVSLTVTNARTNDITLNKLSMESFRKGSIYLFPYDVEDDTKILEQEENTYMQESYAPSFPNDEAGNLKEVVCVGGDSDVESIHIAKGETSSEIWFYADETKLANDFMITTDVKGTNPGPVKSKFDFLRRNDWLKIPITITEVNGGLTITQQHMPIGGRPAQYKIVEGTNIALAPFQTDHGGEIRVDYKFTTVSSLMTDPYIKYYEMGDDVSMEHSTAVVSYRDGELLIDPVESETNIELHPDEANPLAGYFTVTVQELENKTKTESATIDLRLVFKDNNSSNQLILPYTIVITNDMSTGN